MDRTGHPMMGGSHDYLEKPEQGNEIRATGPEVAVSKVSLQRFSSPNEHVTKFAIDVVTRAIVDSDSYGQSYKGQAKMLTQAAADYRGRAAYELFQNAYDAQVRKGGRGRIRFLLDRAEGKYGTLYVANTGQPIGVENFESLCRAAQSTKAADDGSVGNKGVGFKSVITISTSPEIVSSPRDEHDSGYSFRFSSDPEILVRFLENHADRICQKLLEFGTEGESHAEGYVSNWVQLVEPRIHSLTLPFVLDSYSSTAKDLLAEGMVTVLRFPLRRDAAGALEESLKEMAKGEAPIHLFLDQLGQANFTVQGKGSSETYTLTRRERSLKVDATGVSVSKVDLGEAGTFLRAAVTIPGSKLKVAAAKSDNPSVVWDNARSTGKASVAVPLGQSSTSGNVYTFLPTKQSSPLRGHIDAPFYASQSRKGVDYGEPLNEFLMGQVAVAATRGAKALTLMRANGNAQQVVDMFCWQSQQDRIVRALGGPVRARKSRLVPTRGGSWSSAENALIDPSFGESMPRDIIEQLSGKSLIASAHETKVKDFAASAFDLILVPTDSDVADWVERYARSQTRAEPSWWSQFYTDINRRFINQKGLSPSIRNRHLLLTENRQLIAVHGDDGEGERPFVKPKDGVELPLLPSRMAQSMSFLSSAVADQAGADKWLVNFQKHGLVNEYDASSVMRQAAVLMNTPEAHDRSQLLEFSALLFTGQPTPIKTDGMTFLVPTKHGVWIRAVDAHFSSEWTETDGELIERIFTRLEETSSRFGELSKTLVGSPMNGSLSAVEWTAFYRDIGVRNSIAPDPGTTPHISLWGGYYDHRLAEIAHELRLDPVSAKAWLANDWSFLKKRTRSEFQNTSPLFTWFDSVDYGTLSDDIRVDIAYAFLEGMRDWGDEILGSSLRSDTGRFVYPCPTPLASFLRAEAWLPVTDLSRAQAKSNPITFVTPAHAWFEVDRDRESRDARPLPTLLEPIAAIIREDSNVKNHLVKLGLTTWPREKTASIANAALNCYLGRLLDGSKCDDPTADRQAIVYRETWDAVRSTNGSTGPRVDAIVVRDNGVFRRRKLERSKVAVVVRNTQSASDWQFLIQHVDAEFAEVGLARGARVAEMLRREDRLRPILSSEIRLEVDRRAEATPQGRIDAGEWRGLSKLVYLAGRLHGADLRSANGLARALPRLRRLKWAHLPGAALTWDGGDGLQGASRIAFRAVNKPDLVVADSLSKCPSDVAHLMGLLRPAFELVRLPPALLDKCELALRRLTDIGCALGVATDEQLAYILESNAEVIAQLLAEEPAQFDDVLDQFHPVFNTQKHWQSAFRKLERCAQSGEVDDIAQAIADLGGFEITFIREAISDRLSGQALCSPLNVALSDYERACRRLHRVIDDGDPNPPHEGAASESDYALSTPAEGTDTPQGNNSDSRRPQTDGAKSLNASAVVAPPLRSRGSHAGGGDSQIGKARSTSSTSGEREARAFALLGLEEIREQLSGGVPFIPLDMAPHVDLGEHLSGATDSQSSSLIFQEKELGASTADPDSAETAKVMKEVGPEPDARRIGEQGERVAWVHLRQRYGAEAGVVDWLCASRRLLEDGRAPDDMCGFDFRIVVDGVETVFEIKSTLIGDSDITLGPTEVRAARFRSSDNSFRILRIEFDSDGTTISAIRELPNPYTPSGQRVWQVISTQERFRYIKSGD